MDLRHTWHNFNFEFSVAEPSSNDQAQSRVGPGLVTPLTTRLHLTVAASKYFNIGIKAATRRATKSLWDYTTSCSQTKQQANPASKTLLPCPHTLLNKDSLTGLYKYISMPFGSLPHTLLKKDQGRRKLFYTGRAIKDAKTNVKAEFDIVQSMLKLRRSESFEKNDAL